VYNTNRPEVHELVAKMRAVVDEYRERVLIGEIYLPVQQLMTYYGKDLKGANLPFNFLLLQSAWSAEALAEIIFEYYQALPPGAWPNWVLGNHDNTRIATRIGSRQAWIAAMLLMTLPGTLTMYYGEEIGMTNVSIKPDEVQDPAEKNEPGLGLGRDPERTPMPWDGSASAGFTSGRPWLPLGADHEAVNVAALEQDGTSILRLYRNLIDLRHSRPTLVRGKMQFISADEGVLVYERRGDEDRILVLLNLSADSVKMTVESGTILASTGFDQDGQRVNGMVELKAAEGMVLDLDS
jgi:alpha-glucosidase